MTAADHTANAREQLTPEQVQNTLRSLRLITRGNPSVEALADYIYAIEEAAIEDHDYLGAENARLQEALEVYADPTNWSGDKFLRGKGGTIARYARDGSRQACP